MRSAPPRQRFAAGILAIIALGTAACGGSSGPGGQYSGVPPKGAPIARTDGDAIAGAEPWRWIPFPDTVCTNAAKNPDGSYSFTSGATGLAVDWGTSNDLVVFLQGGGACWDFFTCGGAAQLTGAPLASTGPFGPDEFATNIYLEYPNTWIQRANRPAALSTATVVFVPYCTGDEHGGDRITTYQPPPIAGLSSLPAITWHHTGHPNVMAFLKRLGATFTLGPTDKLVIAGSSAGGFGSLANYPAFRWYWPQAKAYLVDDSGPPLMGHAVPASSRAAWYASWNLSASLDAFCPECPQDLSAALRELTNRHPQDRMALLSHLQDGVIRYFFGTITLYPPSITPMDATTFETALRQLGTEVMDPATANAKYFFTSGDGHPMLEPDPTAIITPDPGLTQWIQQMLSDDPSWASAADPITVAAPTPLFLGARGL